MECLGEPFNWLVYVLRQWELLSVKPSWVKLGSSVVVSVHSDAAANSPEYRHSNLYLKSSLDDANVLNILTAFFK